MARDVIGAIQDAAESAVDSAEQLLPKRKRRSWVRPATIGAVVLLVVAVAMVMRKSGSGGGSGRDRDAEASRTISGPDALAGRTNGRDAGQRSDRSEEGADRVAAPIPE